jgi:uncharacterized Zn finger protein
MPLTPSMAALVGDEALAILARPANLRLGREIVATGGVELVEFEPPRVVAKVTGGQRRTVELEVEGGRLRFRCSCTSRADLFCKHCVAAAIVAKARLA